MAKWIHIDEQKPEKNQSIFYLDVKTADYYKKTTFELPAMDDIDKGVYCKDDLVEWHWDYPPEQFVYWFPVPSF